MTVLLVGAWVVAAVYASIPLFWLAVHPFTGFWQRQQGSAYRYLVPFWAIVTGVLLVATYPWFPRQLYRTWIASVPAVALVAASIAIYRRVSSDFRRQQVIGQAELQPSQHEQKLITTGMHARIRHPLYLGHLLTLVALAVGSGLIVLYVLTAVAIVTGAIMIRLEERELAQRFGDQYREYQSRVPAILPFLRGSR